MKNIHQKMVADILKTDILTDDQKSAIQNSGKKEPKGKKAKSK